MKKLFFHVCCSSLLVILSSQNAVAKNASLTSKTPIKNKGYSVINPGETITGYKYVHTAQSPKEAERYVPKYFFITESADVLQDLTK